MNSTPHDPDPNVALPMMAELEQIWLRVRTLVLAAPVLLLIGFGAGELANRFLNQEPLPSPPVDPRLITSLKRINAEGERTMAAFDAYQKLRDSLASHIAPNVAPDMTPLIASVEHASARISEFAVLLDHFDRRLATIESSIIDDPEKAVSIPMLRRDVNELRSTLRDEVSRSARDLDRVSDLARWSMAISFTLIISFGVAMAAVLIPIARLRHRQALEESIPRN